MLLLICGCLLSGFVISFAVTLAMRSLAPRWGLLDQPNARKVHVIPTPLGGGVGILLGVLLPLIALQGLAWWIGRGDAPPGWLPAELATHIAGLANRWGQLWCIVAAGVIIAALGLIDDVRALRWQPKLLVQLAVAGALVSGGVRGTVFVEWPWLGAALSLVWIATLVNALNFLDNMDGLSAGIGTIAALIFAAIMLTGTSRPHWFVAGFLLLLAGAQLGFLWHNKPPAKIFMGDTGSCLIGLWLSCLTLVGTFYDYHQTGPHVILAPLCVLAVPLYDFISVMLIRLSQGRSPFHADKSHFSHRLVELGLSRPQAVMTIHLLTLATGLAGLLLYQVPGWSGALLIVGMVVNVLAVIAILETVGRTPKGPVP